MTEETRTRAASRRVLVRVEALPEHFTPVKEAATVKELMLELKNQPDGVYKILTIAAELKKTTATAVTIEKL